MNDNKDIILMSNGQVFRCVGCSADQQCIAVVEETRHSGRSGCGLGTAAPHFASPGPSLYCRGAEKTKSSTDTRAQGRVYGEASATFGAPFEGTRKIDRRIVKRHGRASVGGISQTRGVWLR